MPDVNFMSGRRRSQWPIVALVIGAVAAGSLALGLLVVGPMLQQRMETPPPALSVNGTTTATAARISAPPPVVEITERPIPKPKPPPVALPTTESFGDSSQTLPEDGKPSGLTEIPAGPGDAQPSIHATISDADDASAKGASASDDTSGSRKSRHLGRDGLESADDATAAAGDGRPDAEMKARVAGIPKARTHRLKPLEALPPLDADGPAPAGGGADSGGIEVPATTASPERVSPKPGRSYRVQVGRYTDPGEAERVKDDLTRAGMSPQVVKTEKDGVTRYRVQIGTYKQRENADRQMDILRALEYAPYISEESP